MLRFLELAVRPSGLLDSLHEFHIGGHLWGLAHAFFRLFPIEVGLLDHDFFSLDFGLLALERWARLVVRVRGRMPRYELAAPVRAFDLLLQAILAELGGFRGSALFVFPARVRGFLL